MSQAIDITAEQHKTVRLLIARYLPNTEAWVYGSRARWTSRPDSDLDMVVFATPDQARDVSDLREAFEESNLPFQVDLFVWDEVPESFREGIEREHVVLHLAQHGWTHLNLGQTCTKIGSGATPRGGKEVYLEQGKYALIRSQNVLSEGFRDEGLAYIGCTHAQQLENVEVVENDVLLNITGDSVARVCQVRPDVLPARVNQHVAIIRPDPEKLDPCFLRYALVAPEMQAKLLSWAGSGATRNALTKGMIESLNVAAPREVCEQNAIAHILRALDDRIELNRRMNETLEAMARALFKSWFVDFEPVRAKIEGRNTGLEREVSDLFPDKMADSKIGKTPSGWRVESLGQHIRVCRGLSYSGAGLCREHEGLPLHNLNSILEGGGYKYGGIKHYRGKHHERHIVKEGELLVANTEQGFDRLLIGNAAIVPEHFGLRSLFSHHLYRVDIEESSYLTPSFLLYMTNDPCWHARISGFSNGTTINMLPVDAFNLPSLAVPTVELVQLFTQIAKVIRQSNERMHAESKNLAEIRDTLLPKLISGEIRIADAEKFVEAVA